ncbi:hypothetical protein K474DRAFT_1707450 [Panus rudis PR-1116 ss-1]|nr:hypothetical protein K474DRAFT_1707450 [Panus rudis PR-1116 ss-1]
MQCTEGGHSPSDAGLDVISKRPEKVKYWRANEWSDAIKARKQKNAIATAVGGQVTGKRGKTRAAKGENVSLGYMEDRDGKTIDGYTANAMRNHCRAVWIHICDSDEYVTPRSWGEASVKVKEYFNAAMKAHFPEFGLCELDWKADRFATDLYPNFYSTYVTGNGNPSPSGTSDSKGRDQNRIAASSGLRTSQTPAPAAAPAIQAEPTNGSNVATEPGQCSDSGSQFTLHDPFADIFPSPFETGTNVTLTADRSLVPPETNMPDAPLQVVPLQQSEGCAEPSSTATGAQDPLIENTQPSTSTTQPSNPDITVTIDGGVSEPPSQALEAGTNRTGHGLPTQLLPKLTPTAVQPEGPQAAAATRQQKRKAAGSDVGPQVKVRNCDPTKNTVTAMTLARSQWEAKHPVSDSLNLDPSVRNTEFEK